MRKDSKLVQLIKNVLGGPGYAARNKFHQPKQLRARDKEARAQRRRPAPEALSATAAAAPPAAPPCHAPGTPSSASRCRSPSAS